MLDDPAARSGRQQALLIERAPGSKLFAFMLRAAEFLASPCGLVVCLLTILSAFVNAIGVFGGNPAARIFGGNPILMNITLVMLQFFVGIASALSLRHLAKPLRALSEKKGTLSKADAASIRNCCIVLGLIGLGYLVFFSVFWHDLPANLLGTHQVCPPRQSLLEP